MDSNTTKRVLESTTNGTLGKHNWLHGLQKKITFAHTINLWIQNITHFLYFFFRKARVSRNVATEPWFIGMMVSVILLIIILINVCILVRERGGKYSGKSNPSICVEIKKIVMLLTRFAFH